MMMDRKSLLENGILEQYLLGELNAQECEKIEQLLTSDIELKKHFDLLEEDFEKLGLDNAISPPHQIKTQLINAIKTNKPKVGDVIALPQTSNTKLYFRLVASVAALLVVGSFWMYSELNAVKEQLQTVEADKTELNSRIEFLNSELKNKQSLLAAIANPDTYQYILQGNASLPDAKVVSYVNHKTKSVILNTERLPQLDADHDYQMWADVEGEMINMGVIPKTKNLMAMTYIDHAESLNITIEPAGGNDHPTVERLVTNVYLN